MECSRNFYAFLVRVDVICYIFVNETLTDFSSLRLINWLSRWSDSRLRFSLHLYVCGGEIYLWPSIYIHLFRCMILTYILQFRLIRHRLFPSYTIVNKLMNIPRSLALLIGMKTLANPLTYLLNKSSRLAKKSDLVLLLLLLLSWLHFILLLPTTTITLTTCYYYYY